MLIVFDPKTHQSAPHAVNNTVRPGFGPAAGASGVGFQPPRGRALQQCAACQHARLGAIWKLSSSVSVPYVTPNREFQTPFVSVTDWRFAANATGSAAWASGLAKAKAFLAKLTPEEKALMSTGYPGPCVGNILAIPRLNFPGLCLQDGPLAIRQADYASVFPAGVSVAASWDRTLMYERGLAMGQEFRGKGAQVMLG